MNLEPSKKEQEAISAIKDAIRQLPRGIYFSVDDQEGTVEFYKRVDRMSSINVDTLKCRRALRP